MKLSFLVTYYNQKEYVKQSLDSILNIDKPFDWEILVGDDGSTDGTVDEVNKYIFKYPDNIRLYVMPRNTEEHYDAVRRASFNRLNLLQHSTGNIFCTLDGDDCFCDTEFIKEAVAILKNNTDVSVVAFGYKYIVNGVPGKEFVLPVEFTNRIVDKKSYLEDFYLSAGGCVYRKNFGSDRTKFISELGYFDDNNIVINSLNYGNMYAVNRAVYAYRQTGHSIYTGINELEQAVLNVQGMDVDLRLIDRSLQDSVRKRYASAVALMFIWRNKLNEILGNEKIQKYEEGCRRLIPSYCYDLLHYKDVSACRKKEIKSFLRASKKYTFIQFIKYCFRVLS